MVLHSNPVEMFDPVADTWVMEAMGGLSREQYEETFRSSGEFSGVTVEKTKEERIEALRKLQEEETQQVSTVEESAKKREEALQKDVERSENKERPERQIERIDCELVITFKNGEQEKVGMIWPVRQEY